jgi:hypothetical protein
MRLTEFWDRMYTHFGETYAESFARDHVIEELGSHTVQQALAHGVEAKDVWRAVVDSAGLPESERL